MANAPVVVVVVIRQWVKGGVRGVVEGVLVFVSEGVCGGGGGAPVVIMRLKYRPYRCCSSAVSGSSLLSPSCAMTTQRNVRGWVVRGWVVRGWNVGGWVVRREVVRREVVRGNHERVSLLSLVSGVFIVISVISECH